MHTSDNNGHYIAHLQLSLLVQGNVTLVHDKRSQVCHATIKVRDCVVPHDDVKLGCDVASTKRSGFRLAGSEVELEVILPEPLNEED